MDKAKNSSIQRNINISRQKNKIEKLEPFLAYIIKSFSFQEDETVKQIETQNLALCYNPEYIDRLIDTEITFVLLHESFHIALKHYTTRSKNKIPAIWNLATDLIVNSILRNHQKYDTVDREHNNMLTFKLPENVPYLPQINYLNTAEEIYRKLLDENQQDDIINNITTDNEENKPEKLTEEQKEELKEFIEKAKANQLTQELIDKISKFLKPVDKPNENPDETEDAKINNIVKTSAERAASRPPGTISAQIMQQVDLKDQNYIDWKTLLQVTLNEGEGETPNYNKINLRWKDAEVIIPKDEDLAVRDVVYAIDASGSISDKEMQEILSELYFMVNTFNVKGHILQHDTEIIKDSIINMEETNREEAKEKLKIRHAAGGTDFRPIFKYIENELPKTKLLVMFTDLDGPYPDKEPDYRVITINCTNDKRKAPIGYTVTFY